MKLNKPESINDLQDFNNYERNVMSMLGISVKVEKSVGKYIIAGMFNNSFTCAENPTIHNSLASARAEASRLAAMNSGKAFLILEIKGGEIRNTVESF